MKPLPWLTATILAAMLGLTGPLLNSDPQAGEPPAALQDADIPVVRVAEGERPDMEPMIDDLGFLTGAWRGGDGASAWEAVYSSAEGGQIVSASKELNGGRVVMIDFEHFYEREGRLRLTPFPFGKRSVEFTLTEFDGRSRKAVFENPEHDFPKRFVYQRTDDRHMRIELTGEMGGQPTTMTLEFERSAD